MKRFNVSSIKSKLRLITIGIMLFMLIIGLMGYSYIIRIEQYTKIANPVNTFFNKLNNMRRMEKEFILHEQTNDGFFVHGESEIYENFKKNYLDEEKIVHNLIKSDIIEDIDDTTLQANLLNLQKSLILYYEQFHEMTAKLRMRGYDKYGAAGELKKEREMLEKKAAAIDKTILKNMFNEVFAHQNTYLIEKKQEHIELLVSLAKNYQKTLLNNDIQNSEIQAIDLSTRLTLSNDLEKYVSAARKLYGLDTELGIGKETGLVQDLKQTGEEIHNTAGLILSDIETVAKKEVKNAMITLAVILILLLIITLSALLWLSGKILSPLRKISSYLKKLSVGRLPKSFSHKTKDEIYEMLSAMNHFVDSLRQKADFADSIGKGQLNADFSPLSKYDKLGLSLIEMKQSLVEADRNEQEQKRQEEQQNWANQGLAKFSDLLRHDNDNITKLAHTILQNLIEYLNAIQGAVYIINDNDMQDKFIEQIATFAYNRKRREYKRIEMEEGLIGRCIDEKATVYMTDIPDSYIKITSGLGGHNPKALLIVPLTMNKEVFGAIEMASFSEFEPYQIKFVERLTVNIASTISSVKVNIRTKRLLEKSQRQAEELSSQEEELRQNLEELQATQEEAARKEAEMNSLVNSINASTYSVEYDLDGTVLKVNEIVEQKLSQPADELIGTNHRDYLDENIKNQTLYKAFWDKLLSGKIMHRITKKSIDNNTLWLQETYSPILDNEGKVVKILNIATDITENKLLEQELQAEKEEIQAQEEELRQNLEELQTTQEESMRKSAEMDSIIQSVNASTYTVELDVNGKVLHLNQIAEKIENKPAKELIGTYHKEHVNFDEFPEEEFNQFWQKLRNGEIQHRTTHKKVADKDIWLKETYSPIKDETGNVIKILNIALDITETKKLEEKMTKKEAELRDALENMKTQEEELRVNLEEMQYFHSQIEEERNRLDAVMKAINGSMLRIDYDSNGKILDVNQLLLDAGDFSSKTEVIGQHASIFVKEEDKPKQAAIWENLRNGIPYKGKALRKAKSGEYDIAFSYTPVKNPEGKVVEVIYLGMILDKTDK